jgi:hypothetical protein
MDNVFLVLGCGAVKDKKRVDAQCAWKVRHVENTLASSYMCRCHGDDFGQRTVLILVFVVVRARRESVFRQSSDVQCESVRAY